MWIHLLAPIKTISVNGPTYIFFAYHIVRKVEAQDEWRTSYVKTHNNPAEVLAKVISMSDKRRGFFQMIQDHIFGSFPEELRFLSVVTLVGIKRSMMSTYV